ncbi:J domain-containing protein [Haloplanus sp. GCM10025708]|uniref:J domain-containing protein n=1 Tax=Haloferacaceae TaxID=1644056 RepID=UPI003616FC88
MDRDGLVLGLASTFAGITVVLLVLAFVEQLFLLFVALPFGVTTYFMWQHATGRLEERMWSRSRKRASVAGERATGNASRGPRGFQAGPRGANARAGRRTTETSRTTRTEAYRTLGLDSGATEAEIRRAYRAKVKEVHPDAESGDEEAFKRVNRAYETLTD